MNTKYYKEMIQRFGWGKTVFGYAYEKAQLRFDAMMLKGLHLEFENLDKSYLSGPSKYSYGLLAADEMMVHCADPANQMTPEFVRMSARRGDRCYAIIDGDTLAAYSWYSYKPSAMDDNLTIHFDDRYCYTFKGFTRPEYRGEHLHGIAMARAAQEIAAEGALGLVSYVEASNYRSLRSCDRMGYTSFGTIFVSSLGGRYYVSATRGCEKYGFWVEAQDKGERLRPATV